MKSSAIVVFAVLAAALLLCGSDLTHVVIMHTGDIHGHLLAGPDSGGSAALATIVRRERPDLMLDAGDSFFGTMISNMFEGAPMIDVMNAIGYDAAVVGGAEFGFGVDGLGRRVQQAQFPFLSANTDIELDAINDTAIFNAQGIRIAVIGLTTPEVMQTAHPRNLRNVEIVDVVRGAERALPRVRDLSDCIIFLAHIRPDEEIRLAKAFPEVRLIVAAHDHTAPEEPVQVGNTTIVHAGTFGARVGRVELTFEDKKLAGIEARMIPLAGVDPDPEILDILKPYEVRVAKQLDTVVGNAAGDMTWSATAESHVGDLVADALRAVTGTQITLNNAGSRIGIPKGPITERTVLEAVPSENTVITMKLTGAQIKRILARKVMNVSGLRVKLDARKPAGERLVSVTLDDGTPLGDGVLYSVTTNDFLLGGGDGFPEFQQGIDIRDTGLLLREAVTEHIRAVGTLTPKLDGRIQFVN